MRKEKQSIRDEYLARLNGAPYVIVTDYKGLRVQHFSELRKRLRQAGAEIHVVKNSIFRIAARDAGLPDVGGGLTGQTAVVTGARDISAGAKILKTFAAEFDRPKVRFGFLDNQHLDADALSALADLPSLEVLRGQLLGVIQAPAGKLVRLLAEPGSQLARVLKAKSEKGS